MCFFSQLIINEKEILARHDVNGEETKKNVSLLQSLLSSLRVDSEDLQGSLSVSYSSHDGSRLSFPIPSVGEVWKYSVKTDWNEQEVTAEEGRTTAQANAIVANAQWTPPPAEWLQRVLKQKRHFPPLCPTQLESFALFNMTKTPAIFRNFGCYTGICATLNQVSLPSSGPGVRASLTCDMNKKKRKKIDPHTYAWVHFQRNSTSVYFFKKTLWHVFSSTR